VLDEASARFALARRFRAAGLRIREDVVLALPTGELTVDGYDPAARVGYEYVDAAELAAGPTLAVRAVLAVNGHRVLVIEATDAAGLERAVEPFVAALAAP
jgi:hypothetical protein